MALLEQNLNTSTHPFRQITFIWLGFKRRIYLQCNPCIHMCSGRPGRPRTHQLSITKAAVAPKHSHTLKQYRRGFAVFVFSGPHNRSNYLASEALVTTKRRGSTLAPCVKLAKLRLPKDRPPYRFSGFTFALKNIFNTDKCFAPSNFNSSFEIFEMTSHPVKRLRGGYVPGNLGIQAVCRLPRHSADSQIAVYN